MARAIRASSHPAPFVRTRRVKRRRKTTVPATRVNARVIVFTLMPSGAAIGSIA